MVVVNFVNMTLSGFVMLVYMAVAAPVQVACMASTTPVMTCMVAQYYTVSNSTEPTQNSQLEDLTVILYYLTLWTWATHILGSLAPVVALQTVTLTAAA